MEEDVRVGIIQEWLDHTTEPRVCVAMLYEQALGNEGRKPQGSSPTKFTPSCRTALTDGKGKMAGNG